MAAHPKEGTFSRQGLSLRYLDWGAEGLPPLVCLHGITQTAHSWDDVAPDLADKHHLFALDARGHGDSEWPPDGDYSRQAQAQDVADFIERIARPPAIVAGLSMGGLTGLTLAAAQPQLVKALIVVDIAPQVEGEGVAAIAAFVKDTHEPLEFDEFVRRAMAFNTRRSEANIRERLSHNLKPVGDGKWIWKYDPRLVGFANVGCDLEHLWREINKIRCPTLVVRGEESPVVSRQAAGRLAEALGARVASVPGAGHSVMGDNPSGFLAAVSPFLDSLR